jgi:hypothetical protein
MEVRGEVHSMTRGCLQLAGPKSCGSHNRPRSPAHLPRPSETAPLRQPAPLCRILHNPVQISDKRDFDTP